MVAFNHVPRTTTVFDTDKHTHQLAGAGPFPRSQNLHELNLLRFLVRITAMGSGAYRHLAHNSSRLCCSPW